MACAAAAVGLFLFFLAGASADVSEDKWNLSVNARVAVLSGTVILGLLSYGFWRAAGPVRYALREKIGMIFLEPVTRAFGLESSIPREKMDLDPFHDLLDSVEVSSSESADKPDPESTHEYIGRSGMHQMEANVCGDRIYVVFRGLSYIPGIITVEPRKETRRRVRHNREGKRILFGEDPVFRETMESRGTIPVPAKLYLNENVREDLLRLFDTISPEPVVFQMQRNRLLLIIGRIADPMFPLHPQRINSPDRAFQAVVEEVSYIHAIWQTFLTSAFATTVPFPEPESHEHV